MITPVVLTFSAWAEKFQPIPNHIDLNASFSGYALNEDNTYSDKGILFEVFGAELYFVQRQAAKNPACVR
ncbi:MAG: hypothetical protein ACYC3W_12175, partial [Candidatus Nanopelagicales bacterium]